MIPKVIHQTGPQDRSRWHPLWSRCQQSWLEKFCDAEYKFWTDRDIDDLIKTHYPEHYGMYREFPLSIMRIDFARFCILHHYGGIYADLDMYCYQDFYPEIQHAAAVVVENPHGNDPIENSLMASEPSHNFWHQCMELSKQRYFYVKHRYPNRFNDIKTISNNERLGKLMRPYMVFYITGTNLVSTVFRANIHGVATFAGHVYNNLSESYDPAFRTKHMHSGSWGSEDFASEQQHLEDYERIRHIDLNHFDFYTDYTNGNYLKEPQLDLHKNDNSHDARDWINEYS